jgi:hypothetical protein
MTAATADAQEILKEFREAVNMSPAAIERWLQREESLEVGAKDGPGDESVGHRSGRRIVELLRTRKSDYGESDYAHMRKVVGYVHRHLAQRPQASDSELEHTRWRYSLMNWGHDPITGQGKRMSTARKSSAKTSSGKAEAKKVGRKKTASKKTPAKKSASKKSSSKKSTSKESTARKSTAKKSTAKKSTAKKSTAKKSTAKKSTAKKSPTKKSAAKKAGSKSSGKKTASKKTAARKATGSRSASKKSPSRSKTSGSGQNAGKAKASGTTGAESGSGARGKQFSKGDKVTWTTSQGETQGVVEKKLTRPMKIKQHQVAASPENPEYLVRSSKSGGKAAHKPESLRKR